MAGWPLTATIEATQLTPTLGEDQERPREGGRRSKATLGRPASPTCHPLVFNLRMEVKQSVDFTSQAQPPYRLQDNVKGAPPPHYQHTILEKKKKSESDRVL